MCKVLETFNAGTNSQSNEGHNDWYVPACGQLALMYLAKTDINAALAKIGGTAFIESDGYWSSSEYDANIVWCVNFNDGLLSGGRKYYDDRVRFVRDIVVEEKPSAPAINSAGKANGVYVVTKDGELVDKSTAAADALGVALITANQRILIEKNGESNTEIIQAAYTADAATNTKYQKFYWGSYGTDVSGIENILSADAAKAHFNGKDNTAAIIATPDTDSSTTYANMGTYCTKFNEMSGTYSDWYIPAAGQLYEIYSNVNDINTALTNIGGTKLNTSSGTSNVYWSSSEEWADGAWRVDFYYGSVYGNGKNCNSYVRFVRDIE